MNAIINKVYSFSKENKKVLPQKNLSIPPEYTESFKNYFNGLNNVFLEELDFKNLDEDCTHYFIRDGYYLLLKKFLNTPNLNSNKSFILHNSLKDFIPSTWKADFLFYEFINYQRDNVLLPKRDKLLIFSSADETSSQGYLQRLKKSALEKKYSQIHCCLLPNSDVYNANPYKSQHNVNLMGQEILKLFPNVEFISLDMFYSLSNLNQYDYINLHNQFICNDLFIDYSALSRGAQMLGARTISIDDADESFALSLYHGLKFTDERGNTPNYIDLIFKKKLSKHPYFDRIYLLSFAKDMFLNN